MTVADFDSNQYAKRLRDAGLPEPVADIEAEAMADISKSLMALEAAAEKQEINVNASNRETGAKIDHLDSKIDRLDSKVDCVATELDAKIDRLDAKVDRVAAELDAKIDRLDAKVDRVAAELNAKIDCLDAKIDRVAAELRGQISDMKAELIRWAVGVGILQMALISALLLRLIPIP